MWGISQIRKGELFTNLEGTPEADIEIHYNKGMEEFNKVIVSDKAEPIRDDVLKKLSIISLHDACFDVQPADVVNNRVLHESLIPVSMKNAYNLYGENSYLVQVMEEYVMLDVGKYTRLSLADWLNITPVEQRLLRLVVDKRRNLEVRASEEITSEMKEMSKQAK